MRTRSVPAAPLVTQLLLLGTLLWAVGPGRPAVAVGLTCAGVGWMLLVRALADHDRGGLGPADHVTVTRGTLACVVAALTTAGVGAPSPHLPLLVLATVALSLDAVDGWVARRTRTASALGARMDMEVDAFLILVLSVAASGVLGWWVLAIGAFRYVLVAATRVAPWLGGAVAPRYWRKAVAAVQGIVLTMVTTEVLPRGVAVACVLASLGLLGWSFGTQCAELWRGRVVRAADPSHGGTAGRRPTAARPAGPGRRPALALQRTPVVEGDLGTQPVRVLP